MDRAAENALIARVLAGERNAYRPLIEATEAGLRRFLLRLTGDPAQAEDLAQDAYIRAFRKLDSFSRDRPFAAWLKKIAYRLFLDEMRRARRRGRTTPYDDLEAEHKAVAAPQSSAYPAAALDLEGAIRRLKPEVRAVIVLCFVYEMSHGEAAQITGLPLGTVKSHILRGRKKLRTMLNAEAGHDE